MRAADRPILLDLLSVEGCHRPPDRWRATRRHCWRPVGWVAASQGTCPSAILSRSARRSLAAIRSSFSPSPRVPTSSSERSLSCGGSPGGAAVGGDPVGDAGPPGGAFGSGNFDRSGRPPFVDHCAADQCGNNCDRHQYRCSAHDCPPPVGRPGAMGPLERDRSLQSSIPRIPRGRVIWHPTGDKQLGVHRRVGERHSCDRAK